MWGFIRCILANASQQSVDRNQEPGDVWGVVLNSRGGSNPLTLNKSKGTKMKPYAFNPKKIRQTVVKHGVNLWLGL